MSSRIEVTRVLPASPEQVYALVSDLPRMGDWHRRLLQRSAFRAKFVRKGRFEPYAARIATRVIVRPEPTFLGLKVLATRSGA